MKTMDILTKTKEDIIDLTSEIEAIVTSSGIKDGLCVVFIPHTTAGVTINENADPDVKYDILMALRSWAPDSLPYRHSEGNSPAHIKASLVGSSANIIIRDGHLALGAWQGIQLCEFDGPRRRKVWVELAPARSPKD